jgi:hypothetical protein
MSFFLVTFILNLGFWYYIMAFCAVYTKNSIGWVYSGVINILISYGAIQFLEPLTKAFIRSFVIRYNTLM